MKNKSNYELFFNALFIRLVFNQNELDLFNSTGGNFSTWPECSVKDLGEEIMRLSIAKGPYYARTVVAAKLERMSLPVMTLPVEFFKAMGMIQYFRPIGKAFQLSKRLIERPEDYELIVESFRREQKTSVKYIDIVSQTKEMIIEHEAKLMSGSVLTVIKDWDYLSNMIGGFNDGRVFLITADTGVGKTNLALNLAIKAAEDIPTLYFNMEMLSNDIIQRMIQIETGVTSYEMRSGQYIKKHQQINDWVNKHDKSKRLLITDGSCLELEDICGQIIKRVNEDKTRLVIVDYDQKIRNSSSNDEEWKALQKSIETIEEIAKSMKIPIIILAQGDKIDGLPKASRRSAQSASAILCLTKDQEEDTYTLQAIKNRFGKYKAEIGIKFDSETMKMTEVLKTNLKTIETPKKHWNDNDR